MISRRQCLKLSTLLAAGTVLPAGILRAFERSELITRVIPKTGEKLPVVGLGSSATFRRLAQSDDISALAEVIKTLVGNRGTVFDTAPSYGASEEVSGRIAADLGITDEIFWATKVNVVRRGGNGNANPSAARQQVQRSLSRLGKDPLDLIQVHNLADLPTQIPIVQEYKEEGRIRYIGTTVTRTSRYAELEKAMRNYPLDFIGVDYAVDNRIAAKRVLPLAQELGIAVLIYVPFGRSRLFSRVAGIAVPEWAREFGADTWAQFFIKFAAAHPAATCVTPATSKAKHMLDNIGAAYGELPDEPTQKRMAAFVDALPSA
ncbi:MAG: aldo/keto reductase [Gammaproteobacteria bacterium]|nr:aldo/keto reductase [Gammaproteobacteria bacterium]